jgi:Zinc finger, C3HC4 type (RING finger)
MLSELTATVDSQARLIIELQQQLAAANQVIQSNEFLHRAEAAEAELAAVKSTLGKAQKVNISQAQQITSMQLDITELRQYKQSTQRGLANINKLKVNLKSIEKQKVVLDARVAQLVRECADIDAEHAAATAVLQSQHAAQLGALTEQHEQTLQQYDCKLCFERLIDTVITPCGHMLCETCRLGLRTAGQCYVCRDSNNSDAYRVTTFRRFIDG